MESIESEFGPMKVLYRHPDFEPRQLADYVSGNVQPECAERITEGLTLNVAMWRGVSDYRHNEHRLTSWASTPEQAALFCDMTPWAKDEFKKVKHRDRATVIAMVLHEWDTNWIEYVVIDEKEQ